MSVRSTIIEEAVKIAPPGSDAAGAGAITVALGVCKASRAVQDEHGRQKARPIPRRHRLGTHNAGRRTGSDQCRMYSRRDQKTARGKLALCCSGSRQKVAPRDRLAATL